MKKLWLVLLMLVLGLAAIIPGYQNSAVTNAPPQGQLYSVYIGTTFQIMKDAVAGVAHTRILYNGNNVLFLKPIEDGWAFIGLNAQGLTPSKAIANAFNQGNIVCPKTAGNLVTYLEQNGWKAISAAGFKEMFPGVVEAISGTTATAVMLSRIIPSFYLMPAGALGDSSLENYLEKRDMIIIQ